MARKLTRSAYRKLRETVEIAVALYLHERDSDIRLANYISGQNPGLTAKQALGNIKRLKHTRP